MKPKKTLKDLLDHLQTDDIVTATQQARRKSMGILQDQGIAVIALLIANVIAEALDSPDLLTHMALLHEAEFLEALSPSR